MWFQRKVLKTNPSAFAVEFTHPVLCVFLALGCFWSCDNGLHRPRGVGDPDSPLRRQSSFVFQHLHFVGDSRVAEKCTEIIRSFLPNILQPFYTGKSLWMGAMSFLNWDPRVAYKEAVVQGG